MRILLLLCTLYGIARVVEGSFGRSGASIIAKLNVGVKKDQRIPARTRARGPVSVQAAGAAGSKATQAGLSGALAGLLQVVLLMWLRTMINYQYRSALPSPPTPSIPLTDTRTHTLSPYTDANGLSSTPLRSTPTPRLKVRRVYARHRTRPVR